MPRREDSVPKVVASEDLDQDQEAEDTMAEDLAPEVVNTEDPEKEAVDQETTEAVVAREVATEIPAAPTAEEDTVEAEEEDLDHSPMTTEEEADPNEFLRLKGSEASLSQTLSTFHIVHEK